MWSGCQALLWTLFHFVHILPEISSSSYYYPHFADEETEACEDTNTKFSLHSKRHEHSQSHLALCSPGLCSIQFTSLSVSRGQRHLSRKLDPLCLFLICLLLLCWLFVAVCGLSAAAVSRDHSPAAVRGLLIAVASLVAEHGL